MKPRLILRLILCSGFSSPSLLLCRAISSREFWTTNATIMTQLAQGVEECLARNDTRSPRANRPFHYSVRITGGRGWCVPGMCMHPMKSMSH